MDRPPVREGDGPIRTERAPVPAWGEDTSGLVDAARHAHPTHQSTRLTHRDPRELGALLAITRAVTSSFGLDEVVRRSLDTFLEESTADAARLWLVEDGDLVAGPRRGAAIGGFGFDRVRIGDGLVGEAALGDVPLVAHDPAADGDPDLSAMAAAGWRSVAAVPLRYRDRLVGVLGAVARSPRAFTEPWERRFLGNLGEWMALSIDHARLHHRVQDDAVIQEREWIARELHDGVGQMVGTILARVLAARRLLADDRVPEARAELDTITDLTRGVYADLREAMLGLRQTPRPDDGLLPTISTFATCFAEATGIAVTVDSASGPEGLLVAPEVEIQLVRILQEALSNVRKHAAASRVVVSMAHDGPFLVASVVDDGKGFEPDAPRAAGWPRYGLQTIRERAASVGGSVEIISAPGAGTTVAVRVPLDLAHQPV